MRSAFGILVLLITASVLMAGCASLSGGGSATSTVTPGGPSVALNLTAKDLAFDRVTLAAPAGSTVMLTFANQDAGVEHNFALYADASATTPIYRGALVTGPTTTIYTFTAPAKPGTYVFRCDTHPESMVGGFLAR